MRRRVFARSGLTNRSPGLGARPFGAHALIQSGKSLNTLSDVAHPAAVLGPTRYPSSAYPIAGSNSFSNGSFPNRFESASHPETAPGTVTGSQPRLGTSA